MILRDLSRAGAGLAIAALALGGCATGHVGKDWQCPAVQGTPCQSVAQADPVGPVEAVGPGGQRSANAAPDEGLTGGPDGVEALAGASQVVSGAAQAATRLRTPEVIGRIWIAAYVDDEGVYREAAWVRVVLRPARWIRP